MTTTIEDNIQAVLSVLTTPTMRVNFLAITQLAKRSGHVITLQQAMIAADSLLAEGKIEKHVAPCRWGDKVFISLTNTKLSTENQTERTRGQ